MEEQKIERPEITINVKSNEKPQSGCSHMGEGCAAVMGLFFFFAVIVGLLNEGCGCGLFEDEADAIISIDTEQSDKLSLYSCGQWRSIGSAKKEVKQMEVKVVIQVPIPPTTR